MKRNYQGNYANFSNIPHASPTSTYFNSTTNSRHSFPSHLTSNLSPQQQASPAVVLNTNYFRNFPTPTHNQWRTTIAPPTLNPGRRWPTPPNTSPQNNNSRNSFSPRKKAKKKPMSQIMPSKVIDINDAKKALECETELTATKKQLVIRFPDPPLDRDTVLKFNPAIKKVHFQQPSTPRFCFIQLEEGADLDKVMNELRQQKFGQGTLKVELKHELNERHDKPEDIDPYILFVGNIGQYTPAEEIKNIFQPGRVDIGPSQKIKNSRYAYVRYSQVDEAIEALKRTHGMMVGDHSINVRFRRLNGSVGLPGDSKTNKKKEATPVTSVSTNSVTTTSSNDSNSYKFDDMSIKSSQSDTASQTSTTLTELPEISPIKQEVDESELYEEHPEEPEDVLIKMESEAFYTEHIENDDTSFSPLDAFLAQRARQNQPENQTNTYPTNSLLNTPATNSNRTYTRENCDNFSQPPPPPLPSTSKPTSVVPEEIQIKSEIDYEYPTEEEESEAYQFSNDLNQITAEYLASSHLNSRIKTEVTDNDASSCNHSKNSFNHKESSSLSENGMTSRIPLHRVQNVRQGSDIFGKDSYENDTVFIKDLEALLKRRDEVKTSK